MLAFNVYNFVTTADDTTTEVLANSGIYPDVMASLATDLNFTEVKVIPSDRKFGGINPDGSWNGVIRMLMDGDIDVGICGHTVTQARSRVVDYSVPLAQDAATLVAPLASGAETNFWVYTDIFPKETWAVAIILIIRTNK